jgi:hypothetical protein
MEERLLALETDVFSQRLKGTVIREAECRSTFCRLELQHSEKQQQRIVTPFLYVEGLPRVAVRRVPAEDGKTLRSVAYLAQASLPPLPPDQGTMDP